MFHGFGGPRFLIAEHDAHHGYTMGPPHLNEVPQLISLSSSTTTTAVGCSECRPLFGAGYAEQMA